MFTDKNFVANKIKNYRKQAGYTQSELGDLIGISDKHVCKIENATYMPSLETFLKLVKVLNIDLNEFGINTNYKENTIKEKFLKLIFSLSDNEIECMYNICCSINENLNLLRNKNKIYKKY